MKIRRNLENRDLKFYIIGYIVLGIIVTALLLMIISLVTYLGNSYQDALEECINKGYDISYCKSLLN
jgi:hypothetical protein